MRRKFVHDLHWIDEEEMLDFAALAQSCPGAVAVNAAILIGWKICGFAGMLTAVLGTILPPMIILSVISLFYSAFASSPLISAVLHGMEAGVTATVLDVACDLGMATVKTKSSLSVFIMAGAFVLNFVFHVSVIYIIPVSYTHLDVYKRQIYVCISRNIAHSSVFQYLDIGFQYLLSQICTNLRCNCN